MGQVKRWGSMLVAFALAFVLFLGGGLLLRGIDNGPFLGPQALSAQNGVTGFANLRIANFYRAQPRTAIVVTNDSVVNATGTLQRISSAGTVGTSNITIKPAGTILILLNTGSNTITFTETGILKSAGNIALGTLDSATLVSDGTNWYQIAGSNN